jgi:hypothetical protein
MNVNPFGAVPAGIPLPPRRVRPRQVKVVSILLVFFGLLGVAIAWLLLSLIDDDVNHGETVNRFLYVLCYAQFALAVLQIASGALVWQGANWARITAIVLCGINALSGVISLFSGGGFQAIVGILLNIALIRMLLRDDVVVSIQACG